MTTDNLQPLSNQLTYSIAPYNVLRIYKTLYLSLHRAINPLSSYCSWKQKLDAELGKK